MIVRELLTRLGFSVDAGPLRAADAAVDAYKGSALGAAAANGALSRSFGGLFAMLGGVTAIFGAAVAAFRANTEAERLQAALETVTGSAEAATDAWDRLVGFASQTPYELAQSVEAFIKLKALGLTPTEDAMRSYGNTASSMGKGLMDMIEAVADATTGEFERLKEFGIRASSEGDRVTLTFRGVSTTIGKNAAEIEQYLIGIGQTTFAGAMERQMATLGGGLSNLLDTISQWFVAIGQGGASAGLQDLFATIGRGLSGSTEWARGGGRLLGKVFSGIARALELVAENMAIVRFGLIWLVSNQIRLGLMAVVAQFAAMVGWLRMANPLVIQLGWAAFWAQAKLLLIGVAITGLIALLVLAVQDLWAFANGHDSLIGRLIERYGQMPGPIGAILRTIRDVVEHGGEAWELFTESLEQFAIRIYEAFANTFRQIAAGWDDFTTGGARFIETVLGVDRSDLDQALEIDANGNVVGASMGSLQRERLRQAEVRDASNRYVDATGRTQIAGGSERDRVLAQGRPSGLLTTDQIASLQAGGSTSVTVGDVTVQVQGSTNMSEEELMRAVDNGVHNAIQTENRVGRRQAGASLRMGQF